MLCKTPDTRVGGKNVSDEWPRPLCPPASRAVSQICLANLEFSPVRLSPDNISPENPAIFVPLHSLSLAFPFAQQNDAATPPIDSISSSNECPVAELLLAQYWELDPITRGETDEIDQDVAASELN